MASSASRKKQSELARLKAQVDALQSELQRARQLATLGTMTAMVAHEWNNLLTSIVNYARLARKNPKLVGKAIDRAEQDGQRATDICQAILGLAGSQPRDFTEVHVGDLLVETLAAMARDPAKDSIDLQVEIPDDLTLRTLRVHLQHIVLNLLINARAAVLQQTGLRTIRLSAWSEDGEVFIRVADNGVGIAEEDLPRIFEAFFTTKAGRPDESGGHGLGLCVCREIAEALGGEIGVRSELGEGTTFTVRLPAEPPADCELVGALDHTAA